MNTGRSPTLLPLFGSDPYSLESLLVLAGSPLFFEEKTLYQRASFRVKQKTCECALGYITSLRVWPYLSYRLIWSHHTLHDLYFDLFVRCRECHLKWGPPSHSHLLLHLDRALPPNTWDKHCKCGTQERSFNAIAHFSLLIFAQSWELGRLNLIHDMFLYYVLFTFTGFFFQPKLCWFS